MNNDFPTELRELIDKWRDEPGVSDEDLVGHLMDAIDDLQEDDDD